MTEQILQKSIIDYLRLKKCRVVKFSSAGIYRRSTDSYIPQPQRGVSDLLGCTPQGRFFAIEVKMPKGKVSKEQAEFLVSIVANEGIGIVARSLDDVMAVI